MLQRLSGWLSETVMGLLALAALSIGLAPMLFALAPGTAAAFDFAEWAIVALFALEYTVKLLAARSRRRFVLDPWRVLDLLIIVAPVASLLPFVPDAARSSPALRMLRLARAVLFGARAGHLTQRASLQAHPASPAGLPAVGTLAPGQAAPGTGEWSSLLQWLAAPTAGWWHASNLSPQHLQALARAAGLPPLMVEVALHEASYPRLESRGAWSALSVSFPSTGESTHRHPILLLVSDSAMLSLAVHSCALQEAPEPVEGLAWGPRCALHVIAQALRHHEELAGQLERAVRHLEELPTRESPESFFEQTFRLKRVLSTAKGDLWRMRGLLEMLADERRSLPGLGAAQRATVLDLAGEADHLHETVEDTRDSLLSLIDLHINVAAHDMNRFMRLLAIVSTLAVIPAITGGLLGMNLVDSPWPVTLGQVAYGTLVLMIAVLYAFLSKGWLR